MCTSKKAGWSTTLKDHQGGGGGRGPKAREAKVLWKSRTVAECLGELAELSETVMESMDKRYQTTKLLGECLDMHAFLRKMEGCKKVTAASTDEAAMS